MTGTAERVEQNLEAYGSSSWQARRDNDTLSRLWSEDQEAIECRKAVFSDAWLVTPHACDADLLLACGTCCRRNRNTICVGAMRRHQERER